MSMRQKYRLQFSSVFLLQRQVIHCERSAHCAKTVSTQYSLTRHANSLTFRGKNAEGKPNMCGTCPTSPTKHMHPYIHTAVNVYTYSIYAQYFFHCHCVTRNRNSLPLKVCWGNAEEPLFMYLAVYSTCQVYSRFIITDSHTNR